MPLLDQDRVNSLSRRRGAHIKIARQDPAEIPIQRDLVLVICNRGDGGGGVRPDAWEGSKLARRVGQPPGGSPHEEACRMLDLMGATVIA
jgi:hypothetical protein